jgi:hypothetical protein
MQTKPVYSKVKDTIWAKFMAEVEDEVWGEVRAEIRNELWFKLLSVIGSKVHTAVRSQVRFAVESLQAKEE